MSTAPQVLIIEAGRVERHYWADLWRYRELFLLLTWRDVLVRYKQTVMGIGWALMRPLLAAVVFTIVFGRLANLPSEGAPYPLLVAVAMLPWLFFSTGLSEASGSLVGNANMISKVYFPRLIVPASAVIVSLFDLAIASVLVVALMAWYGVVPDWRVIAFPLFLLLAFLAAIGGGLWLSALNVKYRDFRYVIPFVLQLGMYLSPVGFSSTIVPDRWRLLYSLNPMVGVIDGMRWSLLAGPTELYLPGLAASIGVTLAVLLTGVHYFRRTEKHFADVI